MQYNLPSRLNKPAESHPPKASISSVLWTIVHSTQPIEVHRAPSYAGHSIAGRCPDHSVFRRNPQFHQEVLAQSLREAGLQYRHMPALGGRRKSRPDSVNVGWRNQGFRGYAAYMQTQEFCDALEDLVETGQSLPLAIMCAEAVPWRCHRSLIADAFVSRGWTVQHIISASSLKTHMLTSFAKLDDGRLTYPSEIPSGSTLRLF